MKKTVFSKRDLLSLCLGVMLAAIGNVGIAQNAKLEIVQEGLNNPTSVAIQPGTGHVFVAESGALRVIRFVDGKLEEVITDFSKDFFRQDATLYEIGPLSLLFIDQDTLLVSACEIGDDSIAIYKIPKAGSEPIKADQIEGEEKRLPAEDDNVPNEGDFYGMVNTGKGIYITCNGDDSKAWIALATLEEGQLSEFKRSFALKEETKTNAPVAITLSPDGYLAIGQMGTIGGKADSLLTFCDPEDGKLLATFKTGMKDITGLAYGPKRGRLFATDFSWSDPAGGALVKLVGVDDACEAREICKLEKPTSLVFSPTGDLYVTLAGNTSKTTDGAQDADGKLIVIKGLDEDPARSKDKKADEPDQNAAK